MHYIGEKYKTLLFSWLKFRIYCRNVCNYSMRCFWKFLINIRVCQVKLTVTDIVCMCDDTTTIILPVNTAEVISSRVIVLWMHIIFFPINSEVKVTLSRDVYLSYITPTLWPLTSPSLQVLLRLPFSKNRLWRKMISSSVSLQWIASPFHTVEPLPSTVHS